MKKILIIDDCIECKHYSEYSGECVEPERMKLNGDKPTDIDNPHIIDPGCKLHDADKEG